MLVSVKLPPTQNNRCCCWLIPRIRGWRGGWRGGNQSFPACTFLLFFFLKVDKSLRAPVPLFGSESVYNELRRQWMSVLWRVACELVSLRSSHTMPGQHNPLRLPWMKGACLLRRNLPSTLLEEWPRSFTRHCGNTGVEGHWNRRQHRKLTQEKEILQPPLPGIKPATFRFRVGLCWSLLNRLISTPNPHSSDDPIG